jgi:hypothetical protein
VLTTLPSPRFLTLALRSMGICVHDVCASQNERRSRRALPFMLSGGGRLVFDTQFIAQAARSCLSIPDRVYPSPLRRQTAESLRLRLPALCSRFRATEIAVRCPDRSLSVLRLFVTSYDTSWPTSGQVLATQADARSIDPPGSTTGDFRSDS